jgi:hypothetical protein
MKNHYQKHFFYPALIFITIQFLFFSCQSTPSDKLKNKDSKIKNKAETTDLTDIQETSSENITDKTLQIKLSRKIKDTSLLNAKQLTDFFLTQNPEAELNHILDFSQLYIEEAHAEGINSDVAFAQMCLETGFLRFGGLVQKEWHNYCGLGAIDKDSPGCIFETEQLGIRAHIQHLQAYATTEDEKLNNELIDPRYNWVHKTKYITDIYGLTGTWAADPEYSQKLDQILTRMEEFVNK